MQLEQTVNTLNDNCIFLYKSNTNYDCVKKSSQPQLLSAKKTYKTISFMV